jgi:hydrogenase expression/formation protein HypC
MVRISDRSSSSNANGRIIMCLGIPGCVTGWVDRDPLMASADIDFGGVKKRCQMACVPEAIEGDYVLVHAGIALTIIDRVEAERVLATLAELGGLEISD